MTVKFIHTSDWQIGKVFRFVDNATMGILQEARLRSISRLGELAKEHGAAHVLVAGDVYDMEALSPSAGICCRATMIRTAPTGSGISSSARVCRKM